MSQDRSDPELPQPEKSLGFRKRTQSVQRNPPDTAVKSKLDSAEYLAFRKCFSDRNVPQPRHTLLGFRRRTQSVKSKLDSAEYLAFRKCFSDFAAGISDPEWISLKLYSEGLIDQNERMNACNKMHSVLERNQTLLSAVEQQIITCPTSKFRDFLDILHSELSLQHLAIKLEEAYGKFVPQKWCTS